MLDNYSINDIVVYNIMVLACTIKLRHEKIARFFQRWVKQDSFISSSNIETKTSAFFARQT